MAREFAQRDQQAFQSIKLLFRKNIALEMRKRFNLGVRRHMVFTTDAQTGTRNNGQRLTHVYN